MQKLLLLLCICVSAAAYAQSKKMCITVDDLPTVTNGIPGHAFKLAITSGLIQVFDKYDIPAIGYVNEGKLYENGTLDSAGLQLLERWLQHNLMLGNHTFSHMNYHQVDYAAFTSDILKGEQQLKTLAEQYHTGIQFFRHPYLRSGRSASHADSLRSFLHQHGYTEAPVTIDNEDYLFAAAYSKAYLKEDSLLMQKIGDDYVRYMEAKLLFYERQSMKLFKRHISQTLLLHANYLNANYLDKLVSMYIRHGYSFVSQQEVLTDPAYREQVTAFGDWGISWIDRWALSRGEKAAFFANDPVAPAYIQEMLE